MVKFFYYAVALTISNIIYSYFGILDFSELNDLLEFIATWLEEDPSLYPNSPVFDSWYPSVPLDIRTLITEEEYQTIRLIDDTDELDDFYGYKLSVQDDLKLSNQQLKEKLARQKTGFIVSGIIVTIIVVVNIITGSKS